MRVVSALLPFVLAVSVSAARLDGPRVFTSFAPVELKLEAPLQRLFEKGIEDEAFSVPGVLSYRDGTNAQDVVVPDLEVSVRGNTSKREQECPFPKLKIKFKNTEARDRSMFAGLSGLRIGTHCGENPGEELTVKYGRLANEKSPWREAFVYRALHTVGVPTLAARPARITYVDKGAGGEPLVRNALLLETDDDVMERLGGTREIKMEEFTSARDQFTTTDTATLAFSEAMVGNFDWCLRFFPEDAYRCNASKPLWNIMTVARGDGRAVPVPADFDLAGMVVGRHLWFGKVYNLNYVASRSPIEIEVLSQVQRTRSLFTRADLDQRRRHFLERRRAVYDALADAPLDPRGRELARQYLDAFYAAIENDASFYGPVVVRPDARVYADAAKTREACGPEDTLLPGTPIRELRRDGAMAEVAILDARWHWAPPASCPAVRNGPVWIDAGAISTNYPEK